MWELAVSDSARKSLDKLSKNVANLILDRIEERLLNQKDPTVYSKPLRHELIGLWRLRVENYRVIFRIIQDEYIIHVIHIGHRSDVYD